MREENVFDTRTHKPGRMDEHGCVVERVSTDLPWGRCHRELKLSPRTSVVLLHQPVGSDVLATAASGLPVIWNHSWLSLDA